jgi:hypothetical protein
MQEIADIDAGLRRIATACPGQWLYLFADGGVVYSETQNRFAGLAPAGISAYRAFDAGARIEDLRRFSDPGSSSAAAYEGLEAIQALSQGIFPSEESRIEWPVLDHPVTANIEIHGIPVLLEHPTGPLENLCRDYFKNCPSSTQPARYHLYAQHRGDGWAVYGNGRELLSFLRDEQLGLGFLHAARSLLYAGADYDVAFHAAMVADGDHGIMLCAPRESGKSTLAAYLIARGFGLLTDEPALLHLDTCSVSSLCLPVSLKEGSWTVLQHEWSQPASAPIHVRSDGMKIRLLYPPLSFSAPFGRLTHIIFPEYNSSSVTHIERLSPLHTLSLLNEGGMLLTPHLARDTFEAFLRLVCETPAYIFRYDSLQEADRLIDKVIVGPGFSTE